MIYREVQAAEGLSHLIASYWKFEVDANHQKNPIKHTILVDGCISLVFVFDPRQPHSAQVFSGASTENHEVEVYPGGIYVGIRFIPSVAYSLFGITGLEIRNTRTWATPYLKNIDFDDALQCITNNKDPFDQFNTILSNYILENPPQPNPFVLEAVHDIINAKGNIRIEDIIKKSPASERHLQRKFKELVGLTLKEFARVRRLRASVIEIILKRKDSGKVIFESGYFDQAHFNNDFSMIVGSNPTEFNSYIRQIEHINVE